VTSKKFCALVGSNSHNSIVWIRES